MAIVANPSGTNGKGDWPMLDADNPTPDPGAL
jgi:hypothetical protein